MLFTCVLVFNSAYAQELTETPTQPPTETAVDGHSCTSYRDPNADKHRYGDANRFTNGNSFLYPDRNGHADANRTESSAIKLYL
jgi:hypothetical protein